MWKAADDFRASAHLTGHENPPIDVMYIADVILGIDIVPIKGLFNDIKRDAALNYDLSAIQVDEEAWYAWEARKAWVESRLRFTLAHELGHWVLHKDLIRQLDFRSMADYRKWAGSTDKQDTPEYQANEFAGRFLVPLDILSAEFSQYHKQIAQVEPQWREIEGMREHLAHKIAPRFGVNHQVIETRFDREGIWPAE
ncbi:MAG: ImmA/IrrE family metallo-endopeptidase [Lentisphaerota bacterium]